MRRRLIIVLEMTINGSKSYAVLKCFDSNRDQQTFVEHKRLEIRHEVHLT